MADGRLDPDLGKTYYAIWVFASLTLIITGTSLIYISGDLKRLQPKAWLMAFLIAGGLTAYGIYITQKHQEYTHNLSFMIFGLITLIPLVLFAKNYIVRRKRQ